MRYQANSWSWQCVEFVFTRIIMIMIDTGLQAEGYRSLTSVPSLFEYSSPNSFRALHIEAREAHGPYGAGLPPSKSHTCLVSAPPRPCEAPEVSVASAGNTTHGAKTIWCPEQAIERTDPLVASIAQVLSTLSFPPIHCRSRHFT